jgi:Protein of unknown function (DUF429)
VEAFAGIDVAFAKRKRLPVCLCVWNEQRLEPLRLAATDAPQPPRGHGNVASLDSSTVASFADATSRYLRLLEKHFAVSIRRIAIDAPSEPRPDYLQRRQAETALDQLNISCFTTPSAAQFEAIRIKVRNHLKAGGLESRLPHANQLWMLVGFALFKRLRADWECLEVYPQATMRILGTGSIYKTRAGGAAAQLEAVSLHTGWPKQSTPQILEALKVVVGGPLHDAVDAYSSAWVAALDPKKRRALGSPPDDVIWVPQLTNSLG